MGSPQSCCCLPGKGAPRTPACRCAGPVRGPQTAAGDLQHHGCASGGWRRKEEKGWRDGREGGPCNRRRKERAEAVLCFCRWDNRAATGEGGCGARAAHNCPTLAKKRLSGGGVLLVLYHRDPCFSHELTAFSVMCGDRRAIYGVGGQLGQGCAMLQRGKRVQALTSQRNCSNLWCAQVGGAGLPMLDLPAPGHPGNPGNCEHTVRWPPPAHTQPLSSSPVY